MASNVIEYFQFPVHLSVTQKLTKKSFYELGNLSNAQQKLLQEQVDSIHLVAQLTPDKTNIPALQTETLEYLEILVIEVRLKETTAQLPAKSLQSLYQLMHKAIPYPLVLIVSVGKQSQLSLAEKQINQAKAESDKLVINELIQSDWLNLQNPTTIESDFFNSLQYNQLNHSNLFQLYQSLIQRLTALLIAKKTGQFKLNNSNENQGQEQLDQQRQQLKLMQKLDKEISELKNKIASTQQFNEKVELNLQLQKLTKQLTAHKVV